MSKRSIVSNCSTRRPSSAAAFSVRGDVATHRKSSWRAASAGSRYATVEPVPRPTVIPSSTSSADASAASCFSSSTVVMTAGTYRTANQERNGESTMSQEIPDNHVIVLFGATGDLAKRKLIPGLYHLAAAGLLPEKYRIIGTSPAEFAISPAAFRKHAKDSVSEFGITKPRGETWKTFEAALD